MAMDPRQGVSPLRRAACWAVHLYTASGALLAFAALLAIPTGDVRAAFLYLWIAVVVDATDGTLARRARVKEVLPHFDGAKLDDIVDYLTFVLVPVLLDGRDRDYSAADSGRSPAAQRSARVGVSVLPRRREDAATTSSPAFPRTGTSSRSTSTCSTRRPLPAAAIILVLAALVFAPLRFLYPSRMTALRTSTIGARRRSGGCGSRRGPGACRSARADPRDGVARLPDLLHRGCRFYLQWRGRAVRRPATR